MELFTYYIILALAYAITLHITVRTPAVARINEELGQNISSFIRGSVFVLMSTVMFPMMLMISIFSFSTLKENYYNELKKSVQED